MNNVIDITNQIKDKIRIEQTDKVLLDVAELIKEGYVKELVGILVDCNGNYYALMPEDKVKAKDFKVMLSQYVDKIPTFREEKLWN